MRDFRGFLLAAFIIAAVGVFFQYSAAFSSDADEALVAEYKSMLERQKDLADIRQKILLFDQGLAMPKVLDNDVKRRQQLVDSLLKYIVAYERVCTRYNTEMELFEKRFHSVIRSPGAIGLNSCPSLSVSWGK